MIWIPIPKQYWVGVSSKKFRSLRYSPDDDHNTGTYEVRITDFIEEYIDVISQKIKATATDQFAASLQELRKALSASKQQYEVAITAAEWIKYLEIHQIPEPVLHETRGRHPKTSWHHLAPIIAAYMMTLEKRPQESNDHDSIAKMILELAKKDGISDLPASDTLADVIAKTFTKAKKLSK